MSSPKSNVTGLVFEYDSGITPPPYAHVFHMTLDWSGKELQAQLQLHYTDREELSEEEILDEGFTLNDDYQYDGPIDQVWVKSLQELISTSRWTGKSLDEGGIRIGLTESGKVKDYKTPANQEEWQLMAQDLIQAIYETTKKEAPLQVHYRIVNSEKTVDCSVSVHFSNRKVIFEQNGKSRTINWEYAIQLMKLVFTPDYHYDMAKESPGTKRGHYIDCGDGYWHELGKGVVNIDPAFDAVGKIQEGFQSLIDE
ncbi:MAG TPA: hypothetical protein DEQ87_20175 [Algoriphagus sp.]|jgi:hypothetical protein|uniref:hypothetical protein n=1 Tax=unclassified Algoriphagus TaxID=2641541 RepID=UPI000C43630A|nr:MULTISPECIES: hypothetical protein [unclassified Algoriphagus]MAL14490.1 hypothetical protein [Algoriphagus sp.]MAN85331.1 hypothetical protein [Algoriphagus sp.]HAH38306.1 hypothetical protein [Algoriphagus sp.]HAS58862.1 hypothetical protein [Algoriphagus sp.]HCB47577.1 hypothetical protein [Algoriphagus sp.]